METSAAAPTWIMPWAVPATAVELESSPREAAASILSWRGDRAGTCSGEAGRVTAVGEGMRGGIGLGRDCVAA